MTIRARYVARTGAILALVACSDPTASAAPETAAGPSWWRINRYPTVSITAPLTGSTHQSGASIAFNGSASDPEDGTLSGSSLVWTSTLNGQIGTGTSFSRSTLSSGTHTISLKARDSRGATTTRSITITVAPAAPVNQTPSAQITAPAISASFVQGASVSFSGTGTDPESGALTGTALTWTSSIDGAIGSGASFAKSNLSVGSHTITLRVVDPQGAAASATRAITITAPPPPPAASGCGQPQPGWIFCDDFEVNRLTSYFEYDTDGGDFIRAAGVGVDGSQGMRARWQAGEVGAGSLKIAFGRTPLAYFRPVDAGTSNYREIYWRMYVRNQPGWVGGGGNKLSRATVFSGSNWSQAAIGHIWSMGTGSNYLGIDPASGTDLLGNVRTTTYNDFPNLRWLGLRAGTTPLFSASGVGQWYCVEAQMKLNDAGANNGVQTLWINGKLEAQRTDLNWVGSYNAYGINAVFFENYWNAGSPAQQDRFFDNLVVSTQRIGC